MNLNVLNDLFDQFKKGVRTSEFWLVGFALFYNAAVGVFDPSRPIKEQIPGMLMAGGAALYAAVRTWLKRQRLLVSSETIDAMRLMQLSQPPQFAPPRGGVPTA